MEIKATGNAVDVEAFAGEVEARHFAALHGAEVDFLEAHAATGNELVFVGLYCHLYLRIRYVYFFGQFGTVGDLNCEFI